jgi:metal-sulfur cluster biosynthetic enzyme
MSDAPSDVAFSVTGDPVIAGRCTAALREVIDPETALSILDLGLVYGMRVDDTQVHVTVTMTSAACPMADMIMSDIEHQLSEACAGTREVVVQLCWSPEWTPERMSARGRSAMGWE